MECNGDCFNCKYDDCILDDKECYEDPLYYQEMDLYVNRSKPTDNYRKYRSLVSRIRYYKNIDYCKAYNRQHYNTHKEHYKKISTKYYLKNRKRLIKKNVEYQKTTRLKDFINWYNKYLLFIGQPQEKNPYIPYIKKMSPDEMIKILEKEVKELRNVLNIRPPGRKHESNLDEIEEVYIRKTKEKHKKEICNRWFIDKYRKKERESNNGK